MRLHHLIKAELGTLDYRAESSLVHLLCQVRIRPARVIAGDVDAGVLLVPV